MRPKTKEIIRRTVKTLENLLTSETWEDSDLAGLRLSQVVEDLQDCVKDLADESVHKAMNQPFALKGILNDIVKSFK